MTVTQFMGRLFRYNPVLYLVNGLLWGLFHAMPVGIGLGMKWYFDRATTQSHDYLWLALPLIVVALIRFSRVGMF
ncbi:ABC transporter ATP-binding protein, partial [Paenibacillus sepulcri]|nr:ABC transporter ATP-binding protein [Paenibacillus sepulcri]